MLMIKIPRRFFDFIYIFLLIYSSLFPSWALSSVSDLRLKTLLNICEAAQSNGDSGTIASIARQLKAANIETGSDLEHRAINCIEAGFTSDKKTASYEDLTSEINRLQTELRALCFDLLELKPTNAITFKPCKKFY